MNKKKEKLQIKENWSSGLTLSGKNLKQVKAGHNNLQSGDSHCPACVICGGNGNTATNLDPTDPTR